MIIEKFKRLIRTDYEEQFQGLIDKLAFSINNPMESIINAFNKKISLQDNIQCTVKTVTVTVDSLGNPTTSVSFQLDISNKIIGVSCINYTNLTKSTNYATSGISIAWSQSGNSIIINHITGLIAGNQYQLTLVAWG